MVQSNLVKAVTLGLGLGLALHTGGNWWNIYTDSVPDCGQRHCVADFTAIYTGAQLMLENPRLLYDPNTQLIYNNRVAATERALPFVYPPITAAVLSPLGGISFSAAFLLFTCVNIFLLSESLRLWIRFLNLSRDQAQWLGLFTICNLGVHVVLFHGQTSALILFLLTRVILACAHRGAFATGLWSGLLCLKPQFLILPCVVLAAMHQWRDLVLAGTISAVLFGGTFYWIGAEASRQYLQLINKMGLEHDWTNPVGNMHNWRAIVTFWLPPDWQPYMQWLGTGLVMAAVFKVNYNPDKQRDGFVWRWIVNVLALLIMSPHLFTHDLVLLIIPCALFLSLFKPVLPVFVGLGLIFIAAFPAINHVLPTSTAILLLILYVTTIWRLTARAQLREGAQAA
jgi:hypothetical protein